MSIPSRKPTMAVLCAALAAASISQAAAQSPYPAYGAPRLGFGSGEIVTNPHPGDLYNGSTVTTPGIFRDRFSQSNTATGSSPCAPSSVSPGPYGLAGQQADQPGMFHDRFAAFMRPNASDPSGGPGQTANTGTPSGCR